MNGHCSTPRISPDGRRLAFERREGISHTRNVYIIPTRGGPEQPVHLGAARSSSLLAQFDVPTMGATLRDFAWTPPGPFQAKHPYVVSGRRGQEAPALYLAGLGRLTNTHGTEGHAAWAPDGLSLVFVSSATGEGDLYRISGRITGKDPGRITTTENAAELFPAWSPTGNRLAFIRHAARGDLLMLLEGMDKKTPIEHPLLGPVGTATLPSWSPDGRWIAYFSSHKSSGQVDLYVVRPWAGSDLPPRVLVTDVVPPTRTPPAWIPGTNYLIVALNRPAQQDPLVLLNAITDQQTPIVTHTVNNHSPVIGMLDGKPWLAFVSQGPSGPAEEQRWQRIFGGFLNPLKGPAMAPLPVEEKQPLPKTP